MSTESLEVPVVLAPDSAGDNFPPEAEADVPELNLTLANTPESFEWAPGYPQCPDPTKWRIQRATAVHDPRAFRQVSSVVHAKAYPVKHEFCVSRDFTIGAEVSGNFKGSIKLIEVEVGVKLDVSMTFGKSECVSWTIPKGQAAALFAGVWYVQRRITRKVWGSALCNEVKQWVVVRTPNQKVLQVRRVL